MMNVDFTHGSQRGARGARFLGAGNRARPFTPSDSVEDVVPPAAPTYRPPKVKGRE